MDAWMLSADARQLIAQRLYGPKAEGHVYSGLYLTVHVQGKVYNVYEPQLTSVLRDIAAEQGRTIWDYLSRPA